MILYQEHTKQSNKDEKKTSKYVSLVRQNFAQFCLWTDLTTKNIIEYYLQINV